ncbi:MAG: hypothetical protein KGJ37_04045 [Verrucomicrobiota bacterium]|nr:hypothetical protein [Verrucomicrobiota bacterium]
MKTHPVRLPFFMTTAFGRHSSAWSCTDDLPTARCHHSLVTVTPRVRDNFALRCVFSRTTHFFAPEPLHARRAH